MGVRELHDFPFATTLTCADEPTPTPTTPPTTAPPTTAPPTTAPPTTPPTTAPTSSPTSATESPSASPSDEVEPTSAVAPPGNGGTVAGTSTDLPGTGGPPDWALVTGFSALLAGLGLVAWSRRRRLTH